MQDVGVEVDAVRPAHGSCGWVDRCAREGDVVVEGCENTGQRAGEIEFPDEPVGEHHAQRARSEVFDLGYSSENRHVLSLLEGFDARQSGWHLSQVPVLSELGVVRGAPLLDEAGGGLGDC